MGIDFAIVYCAARIMDKQWGAEGNDLSFSEYLTGHSWVIGLLVVVTSYLLM